MKHGLETQPPPLVGCWCFQEAEEGVGVVYALRPSWYSQCHGWETLLALAMGQNLCCLCTPTLLSGSALWWLSWPGFSSHWCGLTWGLILCFQWRRPVHWSLTTGFGAKAPARLGVLCPPFVLSEHGFLYYLVGRCEWRREGRFGCSWSLTQFCTHPVFLHLQITTNIPFW